MRVLVTETQTGVAEEVQRDLERRGHEIARCHEPDGPTFPCRGLIDRDACPLLRGVDVAVTVRRPAFGSPAPSEDGVACALRAGVPVVVTGDLQPDPYERWATDFVTEEHAVEACERATGARFRRAVVDIGNALTRIGGLSDVTVAVTSRPSGIHVTVDANGSTEAHRQAALAAYAAARQALPRVEKLDVSVRAA